MNLNFISVNGLPASGKDTQAKRIEESLPNSFLLAPGEIFRQMKNPKSDYYIYRDEFADELEKVDRGEIVTEEKTMQLVATLIDIKSREGIRNFIFTGFPRTKKQLDLWDDYTHNIKESWATSVNETHIAYIVREEVAEERARGRKESSSQEEERVDDKPETVKRRFEVYKEQTYPMLRKLSREGRLIVIRGDRSREHVREMTEAKLQALTGSPERR